MHTIVNPDSILLIHHSARNKGGSCLLCLSLATAQGIMMYPLYMGIQFQCEDQYYTLLGQILSKNMHCDPDAKYDNNILNVEISLETVRIIGSLLVNAALSHVI